MQMLFIDESGTPPPIDKVETSPYFVLGGTVIPDEFWHRVKEDFYVVKRDFGIEGEIKWRFFAPHHRQEHSLTHLDGVKKEALRRRRFGILAKYKSIRTMCVVSDVAKAYSRPFIQSPDDLYLYAYKTMTERFQYYLQDISRVSGQRINGIIVCDHRAPKDDRRLQDLHADLLLGKKRAQSNYANLVEGLFIAPSHLSIGVQFADLVAGAVLRRYKSGDNRFFEQIVDTFRKSEHGRIEGYGLIEFPK